MKLVRRVCRLGLVIIARNLFKSDLNYPQPYLFDKEASFSTPYKVRTNPFLDILDFSLLMYRLLTILNIN